MSLFSIKKEVKDEVDGEEPEKKPKLESNSVIKRQNKLMFQYRDELSKIPQPRKNLLPLLEYNDQEIPVGVESVRHR